MRDRTKDRACPSRQCPEMMGTNTNLCRQCQVMNSLLWSLIRAGRRIQEIDRTSTDLDQTTETEDGQNDHGSNC